MPATAERALIPLTDHIVVKPAAGEKRTQGGIYIPDNAKLGKTLQATVLAVGPGRMLDTGNLSPMPFEEGDIVVHHEFTGHEVELDGVKFRVLAAHDVLCKVE